MARVLVTRPEPSASATAARLAALGHVPVVMPLSETVPLDPTFPVAAVVDAVAATSANALRHGPQGSLAHFREKPFFAVGGATAAAAASSGFADIRAGPGDARSLAALVRREMPHGSSILYLCGRVRRTDFEAAIAAAGMTCIATETYDTRFPPLETDDVRAALADRPVDFTLVYSAEAASALAEVVARRPTLRLFEKTYFLCLSGSIAERLAGVAAARLRVGAAANEDALLALLGAG